MENHTNSPEDVIPEAEPIGKSNAPSRNSVIVIAVLLVSTAFCAYKWYKAEELLTWGMQTKNYDIRNSAVGGMTTYHWKTNGLPAFLWADENSDGNNERGCAYDFNGNKLFESIDANEDGYIEYSIKYDTLGNKEQEAYDLDEDGYFERIINYVQGLKLESIDSDYDTNHDTLFVHRNDRIINRIPYAELMSYYTGSVDSAAGK